MQERFLDSQWVRFVQACSCLGRFSFCLVLFFPIGPFLVLKYSFQSILVIISHDTRRGDLYAFYFPLHFRLFLSPVHRDSFSVFRGYMPEQMQMRWETKS